MDSSQDPVRDWAERTVQETAPIQRLVAGHGPHGTKPSNNALCAALAILAGASYRYEDGQLITEPCGIAWDGKRWIVYLRGRATYETKSK